METFGNIFGIATVVGAILEIILFFKLWGACNDIRRIANKYDPDKREQERSANKYDLDKRERNADERKGFSIFSSKEDIEKWLNKGK